MRREILLLIINGRSYYRCTHRHRRGCLATKHVQRGEDKPPTFNIVYRGKHTCNGLKLKMKKEKDDEKVAAAPLVSEPTSDIIDYDHSFLNSALGDLDFLIDFDAAAAAFLDVSHHYL